MLLTNSYMFCIKDARRRFYLVAWTLPFKEFCGFIVKAVQDKKQTENYGGWYRQNEILFF